MAHAQEPRKLPTFLKYEKSKNKKDNIVYQKKKKIKIGGSWEIKDGGSKMIMGAKMTITLSMLYLCLTVTLSMLYGNRTMLYGNRK